MAIYRLVVTGGGTGGHIYPALTVAEGFSRRHPGSEVLYIGTREGLEARIVPSRGLAFRTIEVKGIVGKRPRDLVRAMALLRKGLGQARRLLEEFSPQVVLGTGGYVSGPVVWAASRMGVPTLVQEQNHYPGVTNRILSLVTDRVLVPQEQTARFFPRKGRVLATGNPVRDEVISADREASRKALGLPQEGKLVLVVGGSRGASSVNRALLELLEEGGQRCFHLMWITGESHHHQMQSQLPEEASWGDGYATVVLPYALDMPKCLAASDLVVARAGAMTLAEITARGLPSILVPFPHAAHAHQERNAQAMVDARAASVIPDSDLTGIRLGQEIKRILGDQDVLARMSAAARKMGNPGALEAILNEIDRLLERER